MRKAILGFAVFFLLAALLPACSSDTVSTPENAELKWFFMGDPDQLDKNEVYAKAKEILSDRYGLTVGFNCLSTTAYNDKMNMIMASGEDYDVCWTSSWSNNYLINSAGDAYLPLDDLLPQDAPAVWSLFSDNIWDATRVKGKIYGVPIQQIFASSLCAMIPTEYYNDYASLLDGVKAYGDFEPYLAAVTAQAPEQAGVTLNWSTLLSFYGMENIPSSVLCAVTFEGDSDKIKVFNQYETIEFKEAVAARKSWTDKGYTSKGLAVGEQNGNSPQKTPLMLTIYKPGVEITNTPGFDVKAIQLSKPYMFVTGPINTMYAVSAGSKNPSAALKLIEALNTDSELENLLVYGIEGKHYTKNADGRITVVPNPGFSNQNWMVGNIFNLYVPDNMPADVWEQTKKLNDSAIPSRIAGFTLNPDNIALELNNCNSITKEYLSIVQGGVGGTEKALTEMLEKLKTAGSDKIIAEVQRQIDEWVAAKQ